MAFCTHCGARLADNARFCPYCGTPRTGSASAGPNPFYTWQNDPFAAYTPVDPPSGKIRVGLLVWSILCTLFSFPLGLLPLIFSIMAISAGTGTNEDKFYRVALISCIVLTVLFGILILLYLVPLFVLFFILPFAYSSGGMILLPLFGL